MCRDLSSAGVSELGWKENRGIRVHHEDTSTDRCGLGRLGFRKALVSVMKLPQIGYHAFPISSVCIISFFMGYDVWNFSFWFFWSLYAKKKVVERLVVQKKNIMYVFTCTSEWWKPETDDGLLPCLSSALLCCTLQSMLDIQILKLPWFQI